jgi:hypothetical protein
LLGSGITGGSNSGTSVSPYNISSSSSISLIKRNVAYCHLINFSLQLEPKGTTMQNKNFFILSHLISNHITTCYFNNNFIATTMLQLMPTCGTENNEEKFGGCGTGM